jgi:imidazoleglycerol phosphate dehydratase HisB
VHIRLLEGRDPEHVIVAIFKALGAALGQACRAPLNGAAG